MVLQSHKESAGDLCANDKSLLLLLLLLCPDKTSYGLRALPDNAEGSYPP